MSWSDDINNIQFEIVTGDKKVWKPYLSQSYEKTIEYAGVQYEFINRIGSLFARRLPKGRSYPLEFSFIGENNVKNANAFELSARDYRAWKITHPFYGNIQVQPLSMKMVSTGMNATTITCQVIESNDAVQPSEYPDYSDLISSLIENVSDAILEQASTDEISASDAQLITDDIGNMGKIIERLIKLNEEYKAYKKALNEALNAIDNAMAMTAGFIAAAQQLISLPATIASNIGARFSALVSMMESLKDSIQGIASGEYFKKLFYNLIGATVVSSMAKAVATQNDGDFQTKAEVALYVQKLTDEYESFIELLYGLEDENFTPDHKVALSLHILMCETMANLYQVMFSAKQERIMYPEKDTNIILLAHRLYGIASDDNINKVKSTNSIGLSEILNIKKDRPIIYYV